MHINTTYFTFIMANHGTVKRVQTETDAHGTFVGFIRSCSVGDLPIFAESRVWMEQIRARGQERYFSIQKQYYAQKVYNLNKCWFRNMISLMNYRYECRLVPAKY